MIVAFTDVCPTVRSVVSDVTGASLEEVALESHVYEDLGADSTNIIEIFTKLEEEFGLEVPNSFVDYLSAEGEASWNKYKTLANAIFKRHFDTLDFTEDALKRFKEIERLSCYYNVQPFSVGFICAWITQMLNGKPNNLLNQSAS